MQQQRCPSRLIQAKKVDIIHILLLAKEKTMFWWPAVLLLSNKSMQPTLLAEVDVTDIDCCLIKSVSNQSEATDQVQY